MLAQRKQLHGVYGIHCPQPEPAAKLERLMIAGDSARQLHSLAHDFNLVWPTWRPGRVVVTAAQRMHRHLQVQTVNLSSL
jgi:hypothetical protein